MKTDLDRRKWAETGKQKGRKAVAYPMRLHVKVESAALEEGLATLFTNKWTLP